MRTNLKRYFKKTLRNTFFLISYYSGIVHLLIFVLSKIKKYHCAGILFYHRFSNGPPDTYQLPHLDIREFKKQMRHVKKNYSIITMDELTDMLKKGEEFKSPSIVITIDDGYLSTYDLAYPVLKELKIPALIYLTTGLIGTSRGLWLDDLMDALSIADAEKLHFPEVLRDEALDIATRRQKREAVSRLFRVMQYFDHEEKILAMKRLFEILSINEGTFDKIERKMMDWAEVDEMSKNDTCFGAHTVTHPTLSKMDSDAGKREIYDSKKEIQKRLGKPVNHFAIPNGKKEDFNKELKAYCRKIGLFTVVSTEPGLINSRSDSFFLKRILPPPPMHVFACQLARYMFFHKPD
jgi:peptidoglycan/xylan/chitin deacetylase (PgdA/CDA1 family)